MNEVHNTNLSAHFGSKKDAFFVLCSCVVSRNESFLLVSLLVMTRFVNMLKIAHKHPQDCWNHYSLLREALDLGLWISSLGCHLVQMVVMLFSPVFIV